MAYFLPEHLKRNFRLYNFLIFPIKISTTIPTIFDQANRTVNFSRRENPPTRPRQPPDPRDDVRRPLISGKPGENLRVPVAGKIRICRIAPLANSSFMRPLHHSSASSSFFRLAGFAHARAETLMNPCLRD